MDVSSSSSPPPKDVPSSCASSTTFASSTDPSILGENIESISCGINENSSFLPSTSRVSPSSSSYSSALRGDQSKLGGGKLQNNTFPLQDKNSSAPQNANQYPLSSVDGSPRGGAARTQLTTDNHCDAYHSNAGEKEEEDSRVGIRGVGGRGVGADNTGGGGMRDFRPINIRGGMIGLENVVMVGEVSAEESNQNLAEDRRASAHSVSEFDARQITASGNDEERRFFFILFSLKIFFFLLIILFFVYVSTHLNGVLDTLHRLSNEIQSKGNWSPVLFTVMYILLTIAFVPAELLTVCAGAVFRSVYGPLLGFWVALACCLGGVYGGGLSCFMLSRYLLFQYVHYFFRNFRVYHAFKHAVQEGGIMFVALIRLSPVIPFTLSNYVFGITPLQTRQFLIGSLGSLPLVVAFILIGSFLGGLPHKPDGIFHLSLTSILIIAFGFTMAVVALVYISVLTRRKLRAYAASSSPSTSLLHENANSNYIDSQSIINNSSIFPSTFANTSSHITPHALCNTPSSAPFSSSNSSIHSSYKNSIDHTPGGYNENNYNGYNNVNVYSKTPGGGEEDFTYGGNGSSNNSNNDRQFYDNGNYSRGKRAENNFVSSV